MTIENMIQRHLGREAEESEPDNIEDLGGFGLLRGIRDRCLAVELRKKDDTVLAIPYALIEQFHYSPNDGITIHAGGREIRIRGKNLNDRSNKPMSLFTALARQRACWVQEQSRSNGAVAPDDVATVIESLLW